MTVGRSDELQVKITVRRKVAWICSLNYLTVKLRRQETTKVNIMMH